MEPSSSLQNNLIKSIAIGLAVFHLYTGFVGAFGAIQQRSIHLLAILVLVFLITAADKMRSTAGRLFDLVLVMGAVVFNLYIFDQYLELPNREGLPNQSDILLGAVAILLVLEATRRIVGWTLPIVSSLFLIYAYLGPYMPGIFGHRGYGVETIIAHLYTSTEGIYGIPLGVSATFVILFVIFGAVLEKCHGGQFIIDLAFSIFGRVRGGPAKVAVVGSSLFGSISGSATANVAGTGTFTIPLMKRTGYSPQFAAAVEAVSSTGGQFMPPVMGAAVFVMIEILAVPYATLLLSATVPALLYYIAVFTSVDIEAARKGLRGLPAAELPDPVATLKWGWPFFIPLVALVYMLVGPLWSPMKAAFWAILITYGVSLLQKKTRISPTQFLDALYLGARGTIGVALACACAGLIVGVFTLTGLGAHLSSALFALASESVLAMLIATMFVCLILGMGMPTTAAYIILAVIAAPTLIDAGIGPIASHLFVFYAGIISAITPPVALAAFAAAGIAGSQPMQTALVAVRIAIPAFIIPYMFVYSPELLLQGPWIKIIPAVITATVGVLALAASAQGYLLARMSWLERALFFTASLTLIKSGLITDLAGGALLAIGMGLHLWRRDWKWRTAPKKDTLHVK